MALTKSRLRIKRGIRNKISGTAERPRISVFKSNTKIYAQIIDDEKGHTLVSASSAELGAEKNTSVELSKEVGKKLAEKAVASGISSVVFDRNGYIYHGKVKALADGAREGGLKF
ncbi:large subunit ribosomal protein L18 [Roseivirga pacifica]|uniref:Large ribosomal subunit protein uL18 n=1 Tax=Roseivirga pacifica TaxID=1267423 RepID=A0A1I0NZD4_9BACT|nr:50S ribosomal protein L18 [Roseivirga pacifica]MCO6360110.1 50S ribosomal protein L18 [Roseivirga pacifica]MCO6367481.1 50S ribosomal protein L18 [Roseivirga pacifica]MCO6369988.1 50S ribosomal protein L18 [Roseivirga pacifica]MCO6375137.1 50S ribosomal protein L18 [Roseivirga pacifica]MCO6380396.1 50S ribosomal protein L18 [Roseivirga pacifica]